MKLCLRHLVLPLLPFVVYACGEIDDFTGPGSSDGTGGIAQTGGTAGQGGQGGQGGVRSDGVLIDDFEDGDNRSELQTFWFSYSDREAAGSSVVSGPGGDP